MRHAVLLLLASALAGCASGGAELSRDRIPVLFRVTHASGGLAPRLTGVTVFETGQIRYVEVGGRARWARLSEAELATVGAAVLDPRFSAALDSLGLAPQCCDREWLAVERVLESGTVDAVRNAPTITLPAKEIDPQLMLVLGLLRDAGDEHLSREFPRSRALWPAP